jgi:organic radical activating enzyme
MEPAMMVQKTTARVLITKDCPRNCTYCCNKYPLVKDSITTIKEIMLLYPYEQVIITGGEPLLYPVYVIGLIARLRELNPKQTIFLYTAQYSKYFEDICKLVDGLTFTIHDANPNNVEILRQVQYDIMRAATSKKSFRLSFNPNIGNELPIIPSVWTSIKLKHWFTKEEQGVVIPPSELLYYLDEPKKG